MEEFERLTEMVAARPGATAVELRDALRLAGRSSFTTADVERTLNARSTTFRSDTEDPPRWWPVTTNGSGHSSDRAAPALEDRPGSMPSLYAWQHQALAAWHRVGCRGVVEAVTGTGKTVLGMAAATEELARRGQVAILVPTRELLGQWSRLLVSTLPAGTSVGLLGDSSREGLDRHDVVVAVVNSARVAEMRPRRPGGLLIADECHRYGSIQNRLALHEGFAHRLGLSATFARADGADDSMLRPYFGDVCYRFGYAAARRDGVIAPFDVMAVAVDFEPGERAEYDDATRRMAAARAELWGRGYLTSGPEGSALTEIAALARGDDEAGVTARLYLRALQDRRAALDDAAAKLDALRQIAPAVSDADRTIVFTQSIAAAESAARILRDDHRRAAALHSGLRRDERRARMHAFRTGDLEALAAPQVLDEGIDVPEADLAVILSASRSRRQMVQRMGRVIRRKPDGRRARFVIVYVHGTIEDPSCGAHEAFLDEIIPVASHFDTIHLGDRDLPHALHPAFRRETDIAPSGGIAPRGGEASDV